MTRPAYTRYAEPDWYRRSACAGRTDVDFDPDIEARGMTAPLEAPARALCADCPVKAECLADAMKTMECEDFGIRGGLARRERARLRQMGRVLRHPIASLGKARDPRRDEVVTRWESMQADGLTKAQAAERMGTTEAALDRALIRARARMRQEEGAA